MPRSVCSSKKGHILLLLISSVAWAQAEPAQISPQELFKIVSPSVFVVEAESRSQQSLGSGVAVAADEVATNCHVVESGMHISVHHGNASWSASVTHADPDHDVCLLSVPDLNARVASIRAVSTLVVGERVYAVGSPQGLELTLSEGIVSGLRRLPEGEVLVQTTAPVSHGSSGGGLFDSRGQLVGITSFALAKGQNLNFAVPADWITTVRNKPSLAATKGSLPISAARSKVGGSPKPESGDVLVRADVDCEMSADGREIGWVHRDEIKAIPLGKGQHLLNGKNRHGGSWEKIIEVEGSSQIVVLAECRGPIPEALSAEFKKAESGDALSELFLAAVYQDQAWEKLGISKDLDESAYWFTKAANQGLAAAQRELGMMYKKGEGVKQDYATALRWLKLAADQGDSSAEFELAVMHLAGEGVGVDKLEALRWMTKAANPHKPPIEGQPLAQYFLYTVYGQAREDFADYGVPPNRALGVHWLSEAARNGGMPPEKGNELSKSYLDLCSLVPNRAAQDSHDCGEASDDVNEILRLIGSEKTPESEMTLGMIYESGIGVAPNWKMAVEWYKKAAADGDTFSQEHLKQIAGGTKESKD